MTCVKCEEVFKPCVIKGDYGRRTICPHCGAMYAVVKTTKNTMCHLLTDDPLSDPYDIDDENENWR